MGELPPTARLLGIGFYFAVCIVLGTLGGQQLDRLLDTGKALTLAGVALGLIFAIWGGVTQLMDVLKEIERRRLEGDQRE